LAEGQSARVLNTTQVTHGPSVFQLPSINRPP
jgi:hypothetical protein